MRLTVLGGSAAGPNTGQGCSGYLVEVDSTRLVLDLGPGTLPELRRHAEFRALDALIVSHCHLDHMLDLLALRFALAYNPHPPTRPLPLWLPPGGRTFLGRAAEAFAEPGKADAFFSTVFDVAEYDPEGILTIGVARVTFAPTVHFVPCWAMRVAGAGNGGDLVYTADTGPTAHLADFAANASVLVAESTFLAPVVERPAERGHLTAAEAAEMALAAGVSTLVLSHLWEELGFEAYRDQAAGVYPGRIEVARPGLQLSW